MTDLVALAAAIDADEELSQLAALGADNQIADRLAAQTVVAVTDPTYVKEGLLRRAIIGAEVAGGANLSTALGTAVTVITALKTKIEESPATSLFWQYASVSTPVEGLNVGGALERAYLDSVVPATISSAHAAAIKALAETKSPKWPGISTDIVSAALNTEDRRPGGKVVPQ